MNLNVKSVCDMYPSLFKDDLINPDKIAENTEAEKSKEEWIWIVGYKGVHADMTAQENYQYELGKQFDMPEDAKIEACNSGFHLCMNLEDVFKYYKIGNGHRFFEVKALVRKSDVAKYGTAEPGFFGGYKLNDKLAAKSIVLVRELTIDEIFKDTEASDWSEEYKQMALAKGIGKTKRIMKKPQLFEMGYSEAFAEWLIQNDDNDKLEMALVVGSQPGLSMDIKVLSIMMA